MKRPHARARPGRSGAIVPMCYFCSSVDTMEPFQRSERVAVLSRLIPRLRWRYCRTCARHFLTIRVVEHSPLSSS